MRAAGRCLPPMLLLVTALGGVSCLPADTRPPAGLLTMTASPSDATMNGFVTVDGWSVSFHRVLVNLGRTALGDGCTAYAEARYDRLLDMAAGTGQKLALLYGIGTCDVGFRMGPPDADVVLGAGVTDADQLRMRLPGEDAYQSNVGITLDVDGTAVRDADTRQFHWSFRPTVRYQSCALDPADPATEGVTLRSNDSLTYDIRLEMEAIFRDNLDPAAASLRFDPFAAADADGDGAVTLAELASIPVTMTPTGPGMADAASPEPDAADDATTAPVAHVGFDAAPLDDAGGIATLADYVYRLLVPSIPRFRDTGYCSVNVRRRFN